MKFGDTYRTYALLGDGEIEEGQVWEAAMFAGNHEPDNLRRHEHLQLDGPLEQINSPSCGEVPGVLTTLVEAADGSDFDQLQGLSEARTRSESTVIVAHTH